MKKNILLLAALLCLPLASCRQAAPAAAPAPECNLIGNVQARPGQILDGDWNHIVDIYETGYYDYRRNPVDWSYTFFQDKSFFADPTVLTEYDFGAAPTLKVPGDWNSQRPQLYYYEGTVWYRRTFEQHPQPGKRYFVYFGAANYETIVGLNKQYLGKHVGGYTPFNYEITDVLKDGENSLIVKVDNTRRLENVPTVNFDWWNYGGITRSVRIVETPATFIRDYSVQLKKGSSTCIAGWVRLDGEQASQDVEVSIPELGVAAAVHTDDSGFGTFEFDAEPVLWCPGNPKLYDVRVSCATDSVSDRIGFRTIETRGTQILLNGKPVYLRGVSIHEEAPVAGAGRAFSEEHARTLLQWAKDMNCNMVRLAHYPHSETMVRVAEEMGIMVWSEIPVYWTIDWKNPDTYANAENQLVENITRDHNRANIVIWSVANETPVGAEGRVEFLSKLFAKARSMDDTRLVYCAMETRYVDEAKTIMTVNDPDMVKIADLISFNQYVGWYNGGTSRCEEISWTFDIDKPVFISEFGGGALAGRHGPVTDRFTEEYQELLYRNNVAMLSRIPALAGTSPWILKDFRSPKRMLYGVQDDYNRKGLVSDKGEKKLAYYVMRDWYGEIAARYAGLSADSAK
ncbi:MAG: beta-glucuronidase [Bacteroidales bacterium]|nr:beta-glucuronidase [Bacteroidales bacterium]